MVKINIKIGIKVAISPQKQKKSEFLRRFEEIFREKRKVLVMKKGLGAVRWKNGRGLQ